MRIVNNITAINSHRQYGINQAGISKTIEKLSSGYRVNRAADDAAGLAISEKMRAQIRGLRMGSKNAQDGISLLQTAEGAMQVGHDIMQRMRELAVQSATDTNDDLTDRPNLHLEFNQLQDELEQLVKNTRFNGMEIFTIGGAPGATVSIGSSKVTVGKTFTIQAGPNSPDTLTIAAAAFTVPPATRIDADQGSTADVARTNAHAAIAVLSTSINSLSAARAQIGAQQNRLEFKIQSLDISAENLAAAESRIRDADMAKEMTEFTRNSILFQASTAMLAHANMLPQGVLQLLG